MEFISNQYFLVAATFAFYIGFQWLQGRTRISLLNPILLTILAVIALLSVGNIEYDTYHHAGEIIEFWLKPAVVALGVPLYKQLNTIKSQLLPVLCSQLAGCVVGILSVVVIADLLGATPEVVNSLAAKSVTTPIAMEVTKALGGIPSLTSAVVICVGIFGGMRVMKLGHIGSPIAQGLSMGTAAHAVGTSRAMTISDRYGAFSGVALTINGILTALLTRLFTRHLN